MEIVIKYKEETLDSENFTEREKAIYQAGYNKCAAEKEDRRESFWKFYFVACLFIVFIILHEIYSS